MMKRKRLILNLALLATLWFANNAFADHEEYPKCWQICYPWTPCDTFCIVATYNHSTCAEAQWVCTP